MKTGTVKFFNQEKGYGFITGDDDNKEIFVHATNCVDNIKTGDKVTYNVGEGKKGPLAKDVQIDN